MRACSNSKPSYLSIIVKYFNLESKTKHIERHWEFDHVQNLKKGEKGIGSLLPPLGEKMQNQQVIAANASGCVTQQSVRR